MPNLCGFWGILRKLQISLAQTANIDQYPYIRQRAGLPSEEIMKYANHIGYTDINPFEVVRAVSDKTLEIREMNAKRDQSVKLEFVVGGFSAICLNDSDQEWFITSDDTAPIIRIRLGKNGWKDKYGRKYRLADKPVKFYDHNF
jgi:hypothetical protein